MVAVVAHMCEALHVLPWMGWGEEHSMGHYLDLAGAILGATLFPLGYLLQAVAKSLNPRHHRRNIPSSSRSPLELPGRACR
jgi:hypothetical protein